MPAAFIVNTNTDTPDATPGNGQARDAAGMTSLRAAVQEANALFANNPQDNLHVITFTDAMTVDLTAPMDAFVASIIVNQARTVPVEGVLDPVVIAGNGTFSLFQIDADSVSDFSGPFTITGGAANFDGGAFYIKPSASLSLTNCVLSGNSATQNGGAIMNEGSLLIANSDLHWNDAGGGGGALYNGDGATATIACASEIYANTARYGGGIRVYGGSTVNVYDDSEIYGNTASMYGGGVFNQGIFTMSGGAIYGNSAIGEIFMGIQTGGKGGGVYNDGDAHEMGNDNGTVGLNNVRVDGNTAAVSGGGLYLSDGTATTLSGCTIQNNTSGMAAPGIAFEMGAILDGTNTCTFGNADQEPVLV